GEWYNNLLRIVSESGVQVGGQIYEDPNTGESFAPDGLTFGPDGKLYAAGADTADVRRFLPDGTPDGIVITGLNTPAPANGNIPRFLAFDNLPEPSSIAAVLASGALVLRR